MESGSGPSGGCRRTVDRLRVEESPLSIVQAVDTSRDTEMGRSMVQKRTMCGVYDESGRTRLPRCRDEQPRWSKSKQSR